MPVHASFCRTCMNCCPTLVEVEDGAIVRVTGDPDNDVFDGYTCVKGRDQAFAYRHPERLLHPLVRAPDGTAEIVTSEAALDDVADRLTALVAQHGPHCIAGYYGTAITNNCTAEPFLSAFLRAIGSPLLFGPNTIDKPGKQLARALHGSWQAPLQGYDEPEVALVLGANPYRSYFGVACGHPARWLGERLRSGMALFVVDPRRSDLAKRATVHLQPDPGNDAAILAALLHVIVDEGLGDRSFVAAETEGFDALARAVAPFAPGRLGPAAGLDADVLVDVARRFAAARRGYVACGVGPGFADSSTLVEYLALVLETVCGHWLRAGEHVTRIPSLLPPRAYRAQADPPSPPNGLGARLGASGLTATVAGMPTAALADEMLLDGPGRVRALLCVGGNPASAWPDQAKVLAALARLDLLVVVDPWPSATARRATHVLAPKLAYEVPGLSMPIDAAIDIATYYGPAVSYAHHTPAIVAPPPGADVLAEWEIFVGLARRMGLGLDVGRFAIDGLPGSGAVIDAERPPTDDELLTIIAGGSRVPLEEVRAHPHGARHPDPSVVVLPKEAGWKGRLQLADPSMLEALAAREPGSGTARLGAPLRLIGARVPHRINSTGTGHAPSADGGNPAGVHPDDLAALDLRAGDEVVVRSARGSIPAVVRADPDLRRGLVSMAHGFGGGPEDDGAHRRVGSPTGRLVDAADVIDPLVGMPRMGGIAVTIERPARTPA